MTKPDILEKTPFSIVALKSTLNKLKKRDEELGFRAGKTEEYVNQAAQLTQKQANDLQKKIQELDIPRLKEEQVIKILDTVPRSLAELKVILQGYTLTVSNENMGKIVAAINEVVPARK
ncbi:hypothetical protein JXA12_01510 [Candidatus Woesearchaeota archaeon]|nr:hypothetical protein [Candidatus Woesearchaeota archaeon]